MKPNTKIFLGAVLFFVFANLTAYLGVFGQLTHEQFAALTTFDKVNKLMEMLLSATVALMAYFNKMSAQSTASDSQPHSP